jgi:uncharacterized membrane protein YcaP (DUF421 family)
VDDIDPFDFRRMFLGDFSVLLTAEIAVRTIIMYAYALVAVRLIGKRGIGNLSPFEYVLVFALGSATGDPMFYPAVPLVHGMMAMTLIVVLQKIALRATQRNERFEAWLESRPALLIRDGDILDDRLRVENISRSEVMMKLRMHGIANVGRVRFAYLEPSGDLSVFTADDQQKPGQSTLGVEGN